MAKSHPDNNLATQYTYCVDAFLAPIAYIILTFPSISPFSFRPPPGLSLPSLRCRLGVGFHVGVRNVKAVSVVWFGSWAWKSIWWKRKTHS